MNEREQLQAEALDAYLTDLQSGGDRTRLARPEGVPGDGSVLLDALVDLAGASGPDAGFARRLAARLRAAQAEAQRPRPRNVLQGVLVVITERMMNVNRRLVFTMAGAAIVGVVLFAALAYLNRNGPAVAPVQVAQQPTSTATSAPTAVPTHTPLPPTATAIAMAVATAASTATPLQETGLPTATPTTTPVGVPTAGSTPTPGEPIALPALATWQEAGYGGGGTGEPLPAGQTYVLGVELPQGPAQMTVYLQREPERLTAPYAAQVAARLGLQGQVYQSMRLAIAADPDQEPLRSYLAVDGAREALFESSGLVHYADRNRTSLYEGHWSMPQGVPSLAEAVSAAEALLHSAGLLEGAHEVAASGDTLSFYRLLEGQWPLVEPFARVSVWVDGQVGQAQLWPLALDVLAEYPILSAQEAWEILRAGQPDERTWQYPYRSPEMSPWGEWSEGVRQNNPRFWVRSYGAGQQAHRFGSPAVWFPTEAAGTPYVSMGNLVLTGDVAGLVEYALQQYAREQWNTVHVWGTVEEAGDRQVLRVEGWEPAEETYWGGTIRRGDGRGTLVTDDGRAILVPDLPDELADGSAVFVSGGQWGDALEWSLIQEALIDQGLPPTAQGASEEKRTVEQVDLAYLALAPNVLPPERFADLGYRAVQPVWRFRGHDDGGAAFEVYVQAVQGAYVAR